MNVEHVVHQMWTVTYTGDFPVISRGHRKHPLKPTSVEVGISTRNGVANAYVATVYGQLTRHRIVTFGDDLLSGVHRISYFGSCSTRPEWVQMLVDSAVANANESLRRSPTWVAPSPDQLAEAVLRGARKEHERAARTRRA